MIAFFAFALLAGAAALLPVAEVSTSDDIDETDTDEDTRDGDSSDDSGADDTDDGDDGTTDDGALDDDDLIDSEDETESLYADDPIIATLGRDEGYSDLSPTFYGSHGDDDLVITGADITPTDVYNDDGNVTYSEVLWNVYLGDGDDNIEGRFSLENIVNATVYGEAGDDTMDLTPGYPGSVHAYGGEGDDTLHAEGDSAEDEHVYAYGGEGNDTLYGADLSSIYGGAGDDVLDGSPYGASRVANGGDGDDTLFIYREGGNTGQDGDWGYYSDHHNGGEGADTFNLRLWQNSDEADQAEELGSQRLLSLSDFEAGVDVLLIDVQDVPSSVTLENGRLTFEYTFEEGTMQSHIELNDENVTADDIVLNFEDPTVNIEIQTV